MTTNAHPGSAADAAAGSEPTRPEAPRRSHEARTRRLCDQVGEQSWGCLVLGHLPSIRYLTGFTGTAARLVVAPGSSLFLTDSRYTEQAKSQVAGSQVLTVSGSYDDATAKAVQDLGVSRLAQAAEHSTLAERQRLASRLEGVELHAVEDPVGPMRVVKEPWELERIEAAVELAARVFDSIIEEIRPGVKERDIALEIDFRLRREGAEGHAFETIVASGWRSSLPHGVASDKEIEKGDLVTIDMGARLEGYNSDMTRTIGVGELSEDAGKIYETVRRAQEACARGVTPGMTGREADALSRDPIEEAGYGRYFGHGTGHGIGLEVHEAPRLSQRAPEGDRLVPGTVFTVEPGIYIPGMGGVRIEDIVVMEPSGPRVLTPNPRDLLTL